jgi:hypothetical protein
MGEKYNYFIQHIVRLSKSVFLRFKKVHNWGNFQKADP